MLGKVDGVVGVTGVVDVAAGGLDEVVDGLLIHVGRALAGELLAVGTGGVGGDQDGAVEGVHGEDLDVLDLDGVARLHDDAAVLGHAPLDPGLNGLLGANEGNGDLVAVLVGGRHAGVDDVGSPLGGHVVLVIVGGQDGVNLLERKGVDDEGDVAQVGLHHAATAHVGHLVADLHLAVAVGALAVAAPEVDRDVGAAGGLEPDAGAAEPPHGNVAGLDNLVLDVLDQPGAPLGEGVGNPLVTRHIGNSAHCCSFPLACSQTLAYTQQRSICASDFTFARP